MLKTAFPPVVDKRSRVLILGSLPGDASLQAHQYYAFKRNAFWPVMSSILKFDLDVPYEQRLAALLEARFALWDVIEKATRSGSLDSAITADQLVANDFETLLLEYPLIKTIIFNGKTVEQFFKAHVVKKQKLPGKLAYHTMPSTSPANARVSQSQKIETWKTVIDPFLHQ